MSPGCRYNVTPLGRNLPLDSSVNALLAAAERMASRDAGLAADDVFPRMTSPEEYCASLRGKLLFMEIACPELAEPYAFYLLGTARDVLWHGAPLRLFLFGLYRPEAVRSYVLASMQLDQEKLTPQNIRSWLHGRSWPGADR
jgi:hypothetical protein